MNNNISVLVVEDDIDINNLLCEILSKHGYHVKTAYSGSEARMCINQYDFHIILLDLMIPGISGEELIPIIRKIKTMPIIVISAKTAQDTKIEVLKLGADDFVSKPFDVNEILARIEAQLRRYMIFSNKSNSENILKYKDLTLNSESAEALFKGENINITPREFHILEMLMSYPNKVFTKANIFETVWKDEFLGDDNTVNVHVSNLRSKIAKIDPHSEYIHTVWGIGYKMS
ncbi:response regulator transcription factor (plasmid) [Clostridium estertheticum]|uniref:response regulator transcription factor n=1 Tax=Clostridium estertheticum TaxID=238834 RepID=UPI001C7CA4A8|nr:response regulator transcription factor [Clostridium estertheticum]MBX4262208.1 response regulator transcription factor [Clostridium estertheticum]WLC73153.1 response regulator transcription factor [Clostridium estertheticum]